MKRRTGVLEELDDLAQGAEREIAGAEPAIIAQVFVRQVNELPWMYEEDHWIAQREHPRIAKDAWKAIHRGGHRCGDACERRGQSLRVVRALVLGERRVEEEIRLLEDPDVSLGEAEIGSAEGRHRREGPEDGRRPRYLPARGRVVHLVERGVRHAMAAQLVCAAHEGVNMFGVALRDLASREVCGANARVGEERKEPGRRFVDTAERRAEVGRTVRLEIDGNGNACHEIEEKSGPCGT